MPKFYNSNQGPLNFGDPAPVSGTPNNTQTTEKKKKKEEKQETKAGGKGITQGAVDAPVRKSEGGRFDSNDAGDGGMEHLDDVEWD